MAVHLGKRLERGGGDRTGKKETGTGRESDQNYYVHIGNLQRTKFLNFKNDFKLKHLAVLAS